MKKGEKGVNIEVIGLVGFSPSPVTAPVDVGARDFGTIALGPGCRRAYPFSEMRSGDCFRVPYLNEADAVSIRASVRICGRQKGRMVTTQKDKSWILVTVLPGQSA